MHHVSTHLREDTLSGKVTWKTIEETYYKAKDAAWIYEVNVKTVVGVGSVEVVGFLVKDEKKILLAEA